MKESNDLQKLFERHVAESHLIPPDSRGLVGVSGGLDSVVLLHLLLGIARSIRLDLGVAHYNHGARGRDSDRDERMVEKLAEERGLEFFPGRLEPESDGPRDSWESYARKRRYEFLEKIRKEGSFHWIATAHHADDQVETVLMRLVEGSGFTGLMGIRDRYSHVVRPLLPFTKVQIVAFARERELSYTQDSSNWDRTFRRNYIRHEIVPKLRELNPNLTSGISRLTTNLGEVDAFVQQEVGKWRKRIVSEDDKGEIILDAPSLLSAPPVIKKRLIHDLASADGSPGLWRHHVWTSLDPFLERSSTGRSLHLPDGWELLKDRGRFLLRKMTGAEPGRAPRVHQFTFREGGAVSVGPFLFRVEIASYPPAYTSDSRIEFVDSARLEGSPVTLRLWQAGDRMKPLGLNGYKKVSDILVDQKIDRFAKDRQYVLTADGDIVWLCGIRLDDRFKIRRESSRLARLSWFPAKGNRGGRL